MKIKNLLTIASIGITFFIAQAQSTLTSGYIITSTGDTLKGQVKFNPKNDLTLFDAVVFQTNQNDKKSYRPNKIKGFAYNENCFVSRKIEDNEVFVKRVSAGNVNLYEYKSEEFFMNKIRISIEYYIEKSGTAELIHIKESKFKKQLAEVMGDDQELLKDIHDKKYEYDKIVDIFEQYNTKKEINKG